MAATLLTLPYDVRYLIYRQLFPPEEQLYIQAYGTELRSMRLPGLPIHVLLVSRQINDEAVGFLYNNYLFNIVGTKEHCLASYKIFLEPLHRHARNSVRMDVFSNGPHSATMCISLQAGDAKTDVLDKRQRGQRKSIREIEAEVGEKEGQSWVKGSKPGYMAVCGIIFALLGWLFRYT